MECIENSAEFSNTHVNVLFIKIDEMDGGRESFHFKMPEYASWQS
jgi:hypothetical protein